MTVGRRRHGRAVIAVTATLALAVAGCAGSDDEPPVETSRPTEAAAAGTVALDAADTAPTGTLRVGLVAPSAADDGAWTQAMVDSLNRVAGRRAIELAVSADQQDEAGVAIRNYAQDGYDLVIAHGTQFGSELRAVADDFPDVSFAIGTSADVFGMENVFAYSVEAGEGGYVNGVVAAQLTESNVIGVVGPVPAGDAELYVEGFVSGVAAENPAARVQIDFIDSFSDTRLASEAASAQVAAGADVLTGTAQLVPGAIAVAEAEDVPWLGTQSDQTDLGADVVVVSQVYRWEFLLDRMLDEIIAGRLGGETFVTSFADGGLEMVFNDGYPLEPAIRASAEAAVAGIVDGSIVVAPSG